MKVWKSPADDPRTADLAQVSGLPLPIAAILAARGLTDAASIDRFLSPRLSDLTDPFSLLDMDVAVDRIWTAVRGGQRIAVYGDYDADGVTSTALLTHVLRRIGADVKPFLPERVADGYGLTLHGLQRCIDTCNPQLIVTVDCGSGSKEPIRVAAKAGIDVVVTDHHEIPDGHPGAVAFVNPKRQADECTRMLAGVGVVFKLCHALVKHGRANAVSSVGPLDLRDYLEWVALGTITDVVPLTGENRILARHGLQRFGSTSHPGLRALLAVARAGPRVEAYHVAFLLGPRVNAAGRVGKADTALELFLVEEPALAESLARQLDAANQARKAAEDTILQAALDDVGAGFDASKQFGLVIGGDGWHRGVVGIVAARLCKRFGRPAVVVGFDEDGIGHGSSRSIDELDLVRALQGCADLLSTFGGHRSAAGLVVDRARFDEFRQRFNAVCAAALEGIDLQPVQRIDAWLALTSLDRDFLHQLERLAPFGEGNPAPVLGVRGVSIASQPRVVGRDHLKLVLASGGRQIEAIGFDMGQRRLPEGPIDVAFRLERNTYGGQDALRLNVQDLRPAQ